MRPTLIDTFADFAAWLEIKGAAPASARAYASHARTLAHHVGEAAYQDVLLARAWEAFPRKRNASNYRTAWKRYATYMQEVHNTEISQLPEAVRENALVLAGSKFPDLVVDAIAALRLRCHIPLTQIALLSWGDVAVRGEWYTVDGRAVPKIAIENLKRWAAPSVTVAPLIPEAPGSMKTAPLSRLRAAVAEFNRRAKTQEVSAPTEAIAEEEDADTFFTGAFTPAPVSPLVAPVASGSVKAAEYEGPKLDLNPNVTLADLMRFDPNAE